MSGTTADLPAWVESRGGGRRAFAAGEVWAYRDLVVFLAVRDIRVRYKQAVFGVAWAVIQPLVGAVTLVLLFHHVAHLSSGGIPYLPFTLVGFAGWTYFSGTVTTMTSSFLANSALVTKVYYPRVATPLASTFTSVPDLGIALIVAEVTALAVGRTPGAALLVLPLWILALGVVAFAVGLPLATLNVRYRDVGPLVTFSVQLLLFITPVAYASSVIPVGWRWVYHLNPMVSVLDGLRWSMLSGPAPGVDLVLSVAVVALLLGVSLLYFGRAERGLADLI